jgi:hypothetical protein
MIFTVGDLVALAKTAAKAATSGGRFPAQPIEPRHMLTAWTYPLGRTTINA